MAIEVHCDCGSVYSVGAELSGKKIRCKKCTVVLKVPTIPMGESSADPAPPSAEWEPVKDEPEGVVCQTCGSPGSPGDAVCLACGSPLREADPGLIEKVPKPILIGVLALVAALVLGLVGWKVYGSAHVSGLLAQGHERLEKGDYNGAKTAFDDVRRLTHDGIPALDGLVQTGVASANWTLVKNWAPPLANKLEKGERRGRLRLDLARAYFETGDFRNAAQTASQALQDDSTLSGADEIAALALFEEKEKAQAEEKLRKVDEAGSKDPRVALDLAKLSEEKGSLKEAVTWINKAAANAGSGATGGTIWLECARIREKDGDAKGALAAIRGACEADPKSGPARTRLALAILASGDDVNEAVEAAKAAVGLLPDDALAARALGEAKLASNDVAGARSELERAEKLAPEDATIAFDLGKALLRTQDKDAGVARLEKAVKKHETEPGWWIDAGRATLVADDKPDATDFPHAKNALAFLDHALTLEPKSLSPAANAQFAEARILDARAAARVDRPRNARMIEERLEKAQAMDPTRHDVYVDLGTHLSIMENHKEAQAQLEKGLAYFPDDCEILYLAGVEAMKAQPRPDYKAAVEHLKKCEDKDPNFRDVKRMHATAESGLQFENQ